MLGSAQFGVTIFQRCLFCVANFALTFVTCLAYASVLCKGKSSFLGFSSFRFVFSFLLARLFFRWTAQTCVFVGLLLESFAFSSKWIHVGRSNLVSMVSRRSSLVTRLRSIAYINLSRFSNSSWSLVYFLTRMEQFQILGAVGSSVCTVYFSCRPLLQRYIGLQGEIVWIVDFF